MSMAAGEYISVSSQRDAEEADVRIEAEALAEIAKAELRELAKIYEDRGVEPGLARLVADQLMAHDELGAHMRDELGITDVAIAARCRRRGLRRSRSPRGAAAVRRGPLAPISVRIVVTAVGRAGRTRGLGALSAFAGGAWWSRGGAVSSPGRRWRWR